MRIAILGGAFDPPHLGHQLIAEQVLDFTDINEVWLAPCYRHSFNKKLTPVRHRVAMTKMLTNSKIKYCNEEVANKLSGETISLMEILRKKYPQHRFFFLIGSDNLIGLKKWGRWQKLITTTDFLVFPRLGFKGNLSRFGLNNSSYKLKTIKHPLIITVDISSTNIRKRVKQGLSIKHLVPKKVEEYIKNHHLYEF